MDDEADARRLLERRVQVVCGKGGVGRTVVACALALRASRQGHRTLLVEVNAPDSAARYFQVAPAPDVPREVLNYLWLCDMTPAGAMREYALMVLRFRRLYELVFENPIMRVSLRSIPSLAEFTMMGKAWYHSTERLENGQPRYDRIIIDAPATGHAVTFLSVSRVVADTVPAGTMKDAAEKMARLVEDPEDTCMHVVARPEDMPVNEALELVEMATTKLRMTKGLAIANRVLPALLKPGEEETLDRLGKSLDPGVQTYVAAARRRLDWQAVERECIDRFACRTGMPLVEIPTLPGGPMEHGWLDSVVCALDRTGECATPLAEGTHG